MMRVDLIPTTLTLPSGTPRTTGMHVSRIIAAMAVEAKILKTSTAAALDLIELPGQSAEWWATLKTVDRLRILLGLAWEQMYLATLEGVSPHPGELCVEDIYMTPDGESMDVILTERGEEGYLLAVHEVKATYKSVKTVDNPFETQWMWRTQALSYVKGLKEKYQVPVGRIYLHILHLCGDYSYPIGPSLGPSKDVAQIWRADFDDAEIETSWELLTDYVKHRTNQDREDLMRDTEDAR
jgi:hypothetical protein